MVQKKRQRTRLEAAAVERRIAERLGLEIGMSADSLLAERGRFEVSWGDLVIGHTLLAGAKSGVTLRRLLCLRSRGTGWGRISDDLRLDLTALVRLSTAVPRA